MKKNWHLDPKDVTWYGGSSSRSNRSNAREPRKIDQREFTMNLVHKHTEIEVSGIIPYGNYSRKEMSNLKEKLYKELFLLLENKVAKEMKISGR
jgi:hypothetical protein